MALFILILRNGSRTYGFNILYRYDNKRCGGSFLRILEAKDRRFAGERLFLGFCGYWGVTNSTSEMCFYINIL